MLHFFQGGGEARVSGKNGGIHGVFQLLVDRIACLLERTDSRIVFRLVAGRGEALCLLAIQTGHGFAGAIRPALLFPWRFVGTFGRGGALRLKVAGSKGDQRGTEGSGENE